MAAGRARSRYRLTLGLGAVLAAATAPSCWATTPVSGGELAAAGADCGHRLRAEPLAAAYNETLAHTLVGLCGCTYCCIQGCQDWTCRACELFPGMNKVVEVHAWRHDAHGFVGRDNATGTIVAAFTGTDPLSISDWVDDLDFIKWTYPSPHCPGCRVHRGFLEAYLQIRDQVLQGLAGLREAHPEAPLLLTGHSLGGALATFAALDMLHALNDTVAVLYTFGKPRIGNQAFQEFVDAALASSSTEHWRITHARDPVPHLPPRTINFVHEGREAWYPDFAAEDGAYVICEKTQDGREDRGCSEKHVVNVNIVDHVTYMGFPFTLNYLDCALSKAAAERRNPRVYA